MYTHDTCMQEQDGIDEQCGPLLFLYSLPFYLFVYSLTKSLPAFFTICKTIWITRTTGSHMYPNQVTIVGNFKQEHNSRNE